LHQLTSRIRFLCGANHFPPEGLRGLEPCCRAFWENRGRLVQRLSPLTPVVRDDLLDLGIFWADLQVWLAPSIGKEKARRKALTVLAQAEALFGPSPVLEEERKLHGAPSLPRPEGERKGRPAGGSAHAPGRDTGTTAATAWDHYALGRALLRAG